MNKYRVQSHRMPHWDYSGNGTYFITMVTQNRECNLGEIIHHSSENNLNIPKYNRKNHFFQPDYHDRIIRDGDDYLFMKRYIQNNPARWINDKLNPFNQ